MNMKKTLLLSMTVLIIIAIIVVVFIVKKVNIENTKITDFELDNNNKYEIVTDHKWMTMQDDGGSHTSIYYQVDLANNKITKITKVYKANLGGTPETNQKIDYTKVIDIDITQQMKDLLNEVMSKEDTNETNNFKFFTISSFNYEKYIYNIDTIKDIEMLLEKIDSQS